MVYALCLVMLIRKPVSAQNTDSLRIYEGFLLSEVMIKEVQQGFDPQALIARMQQDTTFYKAFKSLRIHGYDMYNDIEVLDDNNDVVASLNSQTRQVREGNCRRMITLHETIKGNFLTRKKTYRYRTAALYAHLFFTEGKICGDNNIVGSSVNYKGTAHYEEQLRRLMFNPGQRIQGIPGIGNNVAIFEPEQRQRYRFYLKKEIGENDSVYIFTAIPKPEYEKDAVIRRLETRFRPGDWAIVSRRYQLRYHTLVYDFDVDMSVNIQSIGNDRVPYWVQYTGNWHVFTQKREKVRFTAIFSDFR